jgi:hypothetical protein
MEDKERYHRIALVNMTFTPSAPIQSRDLFAGRQKQVQKVLNAIFQPGQHAILFGDRGVGKTSLAMTLFDVLVLAGKEHYSVARINCSERMDFESLWRSIFRQIEVETPNGKTTLDESLIGSLPENVREVFQLHKTDSIIIIDEMDRIADEETQTALADTIKTLSDNAIRTTLILVGVADSVDELIAEHRSIDRALVQVQLPPMSKPELLEIVDKGFVRCEMTVEAKVRGRLADFAQGLPSYTHLLAVESALRALDSDRTHVQMDDLDYAIEEAVNSRLETNLSAYNSAVASTRGYNFKPVLLACALAKKDTQGFFFAKDLIEPLQRITNKKYEMPAFARHLTAFRDPLRGPILERRGTPRTYRFRFTQPLMAPYVVLRGLADGLITEDQLSRPSATSTEPEQLSLLSTSSAPPMAI